MRNPKFRQENAKNVVRALEGLRLACLNASLNTEERTRWRLVYLHKSLAYAQCISMIEYALGIKYEPYGDEEDLNATTLD